MITDGFAVFSALLGIAIALFNFITGLIVLLKYRNCHSRSLLYGGVFIILIAIPKYVITSSFILYLFYGESILDENYVFLVFSAYGLLSVLFLALAAFSTYVLYNKQRKIIILLIAIYSIIFDIWLIYFLINDPGVVFIRHGTWDLSVKSFAIVYVITLVGYATVLGIHLIYLGVKIKEMSEIKIRALFIGFAFILYSVSSLFDALPTDFVMILIVRSIIVFSAALLFIGIDIPKRVKRFFIKESEVRINPKIFT